MLALALAALLAASPPAAPPAEPPAFDDAWLEEALGALPAEAYPEPEPRGPQRASDPAWLRRALALSIDALPSARALRRAIPAPPPLEGTLDAAHGPARAAALLAMFRAYVGADRWRAALDAHRAARGGQGADADVLLEALSQVAGAEVAGSLRQLLEGPGVAVVRASVQCAAGVARAVVRLEPLLPGRAIGPVPVCLRAGGPPGEVTVCGLASPPRAELALPFCPTWSFADSGGLGYYLTALGPGEAARLLPRLDAEERLALAVDAAVLARQGLAPLGEALALVGPLALDPDPRLVEASLLLAGLVEPGWLTGPARVRWRERLRRTWGPRARALGWLPRPDDDDGSRALRPLLLPLVAGEGADAVLAGEALALARRWLVDRRQVPDEVAWPALLAAARHGDLDLLERVLAAAGEAQQDGERARLWATAGRFAAPEVAWAAVAQARLDSTAPAEEAALLGAALEGPETRDAAWAALQERWDGLSPRLPPESAAALVEAAGRAACEPGRRAEVAGYLGPRVEGGGGLARALAVALEASDLCLAGRARRAAATERFLRSPP